MNTTKNNLSSNFRLADRYKKMDFYKSFSSVGGYEVEIFDEMKGMSFYY